MSSPVRQIEEAMVTRLRTERPYAGLLVESYAAQLDDDLFEWVRKLPATWVTFDSISETKRISRRELLVTGAFEVLCAQRHLVENARRLNATQAADIGLYELLEDNKLLLVNQKLGLGIQPLTPGAVRPVMKGQAQRDAVAVYAQMFRTKWIETLPEGAQDDVDLLRIGLDYLIKPGDEDVDSSDLLTLSP
jgi:phage gp37-like protein